MKRRHWRALWFQPRLADFHQMMRGSWTFPGVGLHGGGRHGRRGAVARPVYLEDVSRAA
jgi:hypothetical protein